MPHIRRALLVPLAAVLAAAPTAIRAAEPASAVVTLRAGALLPQDVKELRAGPDVSLSVGREFFSFLAGDLSVGFAATRSDPWRWPHPGLTWGENYVRSRVTVNTFPVSFAVRVILPTTGVRPYAVAAAGLVFARAKLDTLEPAGNDRRELPTLRETHVVPELSAGVGFTIDLGRNVCAGIEGRYARSKLAAFGQNGFRLDAVRATAVLAWTR